MFKFKWVLVGLMVLAAFLIAQSGFCAEENKDVVKEVAEGTVGGVATAVQATADTSAKVVQATVDTGAKVVQGTVDTGAKAVDVTGKTAGAVVEGTHQALVDAEKKKIERKKQNIPEPAAIGTPAREKARFGWGKGEKKGWKGGTVPTGQAKK